MEITTAQKPLSLEVVKAGFNAALSRNNIYLQKLWDRVNSLEYNEDNLHSISEVIKEIDTAEKVVDAAFKAGKSPHLAICQMYDENKRDYVSIFGDMRKLPKERYTKLCKDIQARAAKQAAEKFRIDEITKGIESNLIRFSQDIAAAESSEKLLKIERMINLEKANKTKYAEYAEEAFEKFTGLNGMLAEQKIKIRELEKIQAEKEEAKHHNDDAKLMQLLDREDEVMAQVEEAKVVVQEKMINHSVAFSAMYAEEMLPDIRVKKTIWRAKIEDIYEVIKKNISCVDFCLNSEKAREKIKQFKEDGTFAGKTEVVIDGVRYYEEKTF